MILISLSLNEERNMTQNTDEYLTKCCTEHAVNYIQIHELWKILHNKSHLENALNDVDRYGYDYVYKKPLKDIILNEH